MKLLEKGNYGFEIVNVDVGYIGKASGKPSIKLMLAIKDNKGNFIKNENNKNVLVFDYISKANPIKDFSKKKLESFLYSINKGSLIGKNLENEDLLNQCGTVSIKNESNEQYGDSNKVDKYVVRSCEDFINKHKAEQLKQLEINIEEDIKFNDLPF